MTESGEITVLPGHEPLLSVVRPGILRLKYTTDTETREETYVTGGGVITVTPDDITVVIDSIDDTESLDTAEDIERMKREAQAMIASYQAENPSDKTPERLMELEYQYLKYAAMQELVKNSSLRSSNARK